MIQIKSLGWPKLSHLGTFYKLGCECCLILSFSAGVGCTKSAPVKPAAVAPALVAVTVTKPQFKSWRNIIAATGNISAQDEISLKDKMANSADLDAVLVVVGERVVAGQTLAKLDTQQAKIEVAMEQATFAGKQAVFAKALTRIKQSQALEAAGAISANEVLDDLTLLKTSKADLDLAQANLAEKKLNLANATIKAPAAGIIAQAVTGVGSTITPDTELFSLIKAESLEWQAEINANEISQVHPGQAVIVTGLNGDLINGTVRQISPLLSSTSASALAVVSLSPNSSLKSGMYLSGEINVAVHRALVIPTSAILNKSGYTYVMKITATNTVVPVKVELGRFESAQVEVLSAGLSPQDLIAASGVEFVNPGDSVIIAPSPAENAPKQAEKSK